MQVYPPNEGSNQFHNTRDEPLMNYSLVPGSFPLSYWILDVGRFIQKDQWFGLPQRIHFAFQNENTNISPIDVLSSKRSI